MEQAGKIHAPLWGFSDEFTDFEAAQTTSPIRDIFRRHQMARNNHHESATRAGVRDSTDRAEDVMQTGIQAA